jgi:hypothetical protein
VGKPVKTPRKPAKPDDTSSRRGQTAAEERSKATLALGNFSMSGGGPQLVRAK